MAEGLRLLDQATDEMAIVDDTQAWSMALEVTPANGQHRRGAKIADEAVVIDVHFETATDEARGHGIKDAAHADRRRARHRDGGGREVRGPMLGQRAAISTVSTARPGAFLRAMNSWRKAW